MAVLAVRAPTIDQRVLGRIALQRQGLLGAAAFGRGRAATLRAIERLGYVQIDTISVVARAHHHVLRSRVPNFQPSHLRSLVNAGEVFEYWSHAAAFLPMKHYRFSLVRKRAFRDGENHWGGSRDRKLMAEILLRIEREGPLRSRDFEQGGGGAGGWWEWKPAKRALEQLFMQGDLMVAARDGFQKTYELPERLLPDWVDASPPTPREYAAHLIDSTLTAQGFASAPSFSYLRKGGPLREAIQAELRERLGRRELVALRLGDGAEVYGDPDLLDFAPARVAKRARILSPFDNAIIQRERTRALFNFDYQIECYLPAAKRRYGYFCLPVLYGSEFVARMDCKAHRNTGLLEVRSLHLESGVRPDAAMVIALAQATAEFAHFNGCDRLELRYCSNAALGAQLQRVMG